MQLASRVRKNGAFECPRSHYLPRKLRVPEMLTGNEERSLLLRRPTLLCAAIAA
jgi:hypothetical protein